MQVLRQEESPAPSKEFPLRINDLLQATILGTDEEVPTTYISRIEDVADGKILIGWPTSAGIRAPLHENDQLAVTFVECGGAFSFSGQVIERIFDPIPLIRLLPDSQIQKIQRRNYVRVPAMVETRLFSRVVTVDKNDPSKDANMIATRTINLSGGGFLIHAPALPRLGGIYDVRMMIPGSDYPLEMTAKVVRCDKVADPVKGDYYAAGFAFVQVQEHARRRIVSYVFRFQQSSLAS